MYITKSEHWYKLRTSGDNDLQQRFIDFNKPIALVWDFDSVYVRAVIIGKSPSLLLSFAVNLKHLKIKNNKNKLKTVWN